MKIAIIQNVPLNDHRMIHTDGIATELIRRGHEVDVIIQESNEKPMFNDLSYNVINISGYTYSIAGQLKFAYGIFKLLEKQEYDIIHAKNPFSSVLPALLRKSKSKIVYDIRGLWIDFGIHSGIISKKIGYILKKTDTFCMRKSDRVIAISHELKNILVKRKLNEEKIDVIVGDGVDLDKMKKLNIEDIRCFLDIEGIIIGYMGTIARSRHSERIIEAYEIVHSSIASAKLVMIGPCREDDLKYYKRLVNEKNLNNYVFFTGFIPHDEALCFMKSFDVAVAYHEGDLSIFNVAVPTKILEYLANGCSIVATDQKMYKNLLTHKKDAYLKSQDYKSFAEGIIRVLEDDKLSKRISKNALMTAEKYSFIKVTDKIEKVYEKALFLK